ncbi:MAG: UDP-N-acetylmuramate dehydrogenase [Alphaproteobacteria bacterium]
MQQDLVKAGVRGALTYDAPIGAQSWFGCGGTADLLFEPLDIADMELFFSLCPPSLPIMIIGGLANTIVRDGGVRGVCVRLGKNFSAIRRLGDEPYFSVGCGALNGSVAAAAVKAGIGGLEFLSGIPGSVGGALAMNAGAYGTEMKDVLIGVRGFKKDVGRVGRVGRNDPLIQLTRDDLHMSYRHSEIPDGLIITECIVKGVVEDYETVKARMNDIKAKRNETQPIREKTGGSTFANPSSVELQIAGLPEGTKAWQIVDQVGGRGLTLGGAMISELHANFMINTGTATASDLEGLGEEIITRAYEAFGFKLRWEIKRIGSP